MYVSNHIYEFNFTVDIVKNKNHFFEWPFKRKCKEPVSSLHR